MTVYIYFSSAFSSLSVRPGRIRADLKEKFRARAGPGPEKIDRAGPGRAGLFFDKISGPRPEKIDRAGLFFDKISGPGPGFFWRKSRAGPARPVNITGFKVYM